MKRSPLRRTNSLKRSSMPRGERGIKPVNSTRKKKRHAETFGKQAQRCRELPCCVPECGWVPCEGNPTHPHHWPTVAAGGKDRDVSPLCPLHHNIFHAECGSSAAFLDRLEVDVTEVARLLTERIKEGS